MSNAKPKLKKYNLGYLVSDLLAGMSVFMIAIPLCLGVSIASGVPLASGLIAGVVGGVLVGILSDSNVSVSGPSPSLIAVILAIMHYITLDQFFAVVVVVGFLQIIMSGLNLGKYAAYVPSSVIRGLLGAIGVIIILKQTSHFFGYHVVPTGDFNFRQKDHHNTFSEIFIMLRHIHYGATIVGLSTLLSILGWERVSGKLYGKLFWLSKIPSAIVGISVGTLVSFLLTFIPKLSISATQLVRMPDGGGITMNHIYGFPDIIQAASGTFWFIALGVAVLCSLEGMLNIESSDKIDVYKRKTNTNRELFAQGIGNVVSGFLGGLPVTSVVLRGAANINAGAVSKLATVFHGLFLMLALFLFGSYLNFIPLSALAAVLIITGYRLIKIQVVKDMYRRGMDQFVPFCVTVIAITFTNPLFGVIIGMTVGFVFLLKKNYSNPFRVHHEHFHIQPVTRIELAQHVSFLHKVQLRNILYSLVPKTHAIIDARNTRYIDHDVTELISEFNADSASRGIKLNLLGLKNKKGGIDTANDFFSVITKGVQNSLTPDDVLNVLMRGNQRFVLQKPIPRDVSAQIKQTAQGQYPIAVVVGCIDSRAHVEDIFDVGFGDIFTIRVAGNVISDDVLGSIEFACKVVGAKLIVVLGHSDCGAVKAACDDFKMGKITALLRKIKKSVTLEKETVVDRNSNNSSFVDRVARLNISNSKQDIIAGSRILHTMLKEKQITLVGAMYNVRTGEVVFE